MMPSYIRANARMLRLIQRSSASSRAPIASSRSVSRSLATAVSSRISYSRDDIMNLLNKVGNQTQDARPYAFFAILEASNVETNTKIFAFFFSGHSESYRGNKIAMTWCIPPHLATMPLFHSLAWWNLLR